MHLQEKSDIFKKKVAKLRGEGHKPERKKSHVYEKKVAKLSRKSRKIFEEKSCMFMRKKVTRLRGKVSKFMTKHHKLKSRKFTKGPNLLI